MSEQNQVAFLRLTRLKGIGPVLTKRLLEHFGTPAAILAAHPSNLAAVEGVGTVKANQIVATAAATEAEARAEFARAKVHGIAIITLDDYRYPPALKTIADPPPLLYVRGELWRDDALAVGIVGARQCTLYGREQAQRIAAQLAEAGMTIVSGGARGIDSCAHLGALQVGGRTIVVTGCGLLHTYPPENDSLYQRIVAEHRGAIISELPLDAPPAKENFPPRNRIIAGMSLGVLVVEANLGSGSLITARLAAADYGREVFALPGRVDSFSSAGTHHLIKTGTAHLVESAADILEYLGDVGRPLAQSAEAARQTDMEAHDLFEHGIDPPKRPAATLTSTQERILATLSAKGASMDDIVDATGLPAQVVVAEMTTLQIQSKVKWLQGNRFAPA